MPNGILGNLVEDGGIGVMGNIESLVQAAFASAARTEKRNLELLNSPRGLVPRTLAI